MIQDFYQQYSRYYDVIANDRDFSAQTRLIRNRLNTNEGQKKVLELFAGPAYHGIEFQSGHNDYVAAIESSPHMKHLAEDKGFGSPGEYYIGSIPTDLKQFSENTFDCILGLRYSIGYLSRENLYEMLRQCKRLIKASGKVFLEVHDISAITGNLTNDSIRDRKKTTDSDEEINCIWPDGAIQWDNLDYKASMNVSLTIEREQEKVEKSFVSIENIYCAKEVIFLANLIGFSSALPQFEGNDKQVWFNEFKSSIIIELFL
ncbi:class I SAM-dependent methyltransferase [Roseivirga sp. BDSF3-8]|uniref:class I SAM-dependent methyltransferase n=1 Tax=Roseivirga sp. BDSF3-8 TaxID=3241598 RepID=UPI0035319B7A